MIFIEEALEKEVFFHLFARKSIKFMREFVENRFVIVGAL